MKISFVIAGGLVSGFGHVARCLKLIDYIGISHEISCVIIREPGSEAAVAALLHRVPDCLQVESLTSKTIRGHLSATDMAIVDLFSNAFIGKYDEFHDAVGQMAGSKEGGCKRVLHIGDVRQPRPLPGVTLICNDFRTEFELEIEGSSCVIRGRRATIMSHEMRLARQRAHTIKLRPDSVVVALGSALQRSLVMKLMRSVRDLGLHDVYVVNGVGLGLQHEFPSFRWLGRMSHGHVIELMSRSDIVITNEGQTKTESVSIGIPTVCVPFYEAHGVPWESFCSMNVSLNLGSIETLDPTRLTSQLRAYAADVHTRVLHSQRGRRFLGDKGVNDAIQRAMTYEVD